MAFEQGKYDVRLVQLVSRPWWPSLAIMGSGESREEALDGSHRALSMRTGRGEPRDSGEGVQSARIWEPGQGRWQTCLISWGLAAASWVSVSCDTIEGLEGKKSTGQPPGEIMARPRKGLSGQPGALCFFSPGWFRFPFLKGPAQLLTHLGTPPSLKTGPGGCELESRSPLWCWETGYTVREVLQLQEALAVPVVVL